LPSFPLPTAPALDETAGSTTLSDGSTTNGALFAGVDTSGTGTGNFQTFLRVAGHSHDTDSYAGTEEGFNTNADPLPLDDVPSDKHTDAIQLSDIPTVVVGNTIY